MLKYYLGQVCRWIGIILMPGFIVSIFRRFFFDTPLPNILLILRNAGKLTLQDSLDVYLGLALVGCPVFLAIYLIIRYTIYKNIGMKHIENS